MMSRPGSDPFWESAEAVERFAARQPDVRLLELLDKYPDPSEIRVLDMGCAAGRNTEVLAARGFDLYAVDSSAAMVARTRERVAGILGAEEVDRRVLLGRMEDLGQFADGSVSLVVALGVLHQADSDEQWIRTIEEISRVLRAGGVLLLAAWSPRSRPDGEPVRKVVGEDHVYEGFHSGRHYLVESPPLDAALASVGLLPAVPTDEVEVETERGRRVTINGLYERTSRPGTSRPMRGALLALARSAVERALDGGPPPEIAPVLEALTEPRAAFVTIRDPESGRLRGCRGECPARRPLPECVSRVAVSAALDDPRFPPVTREELPALRFEISALTAPAPIQPEDVVVGEHGLLLSGEGVVGLLLPQVPVEQGWSRQEYLDGLCIKAGVPPGSWRRSELTLSGFEAEVWADE
jgi:AmmeMemoRadiSam system protein A